MKTNWDLTHLYKNYDEWKKDYTTLVYLINEFKITNVKDTIDYLDKLDLLIEKLYCYPKRKLDLNSKDEESSKFINEALKLYSKITSFHNEFNSYIINDLKDINNNEYNRYLYLILRQKEHISKDNEYQKSIEKVRNSYRKIIESLKFSDITCDNKLENITRTNYYKYLSNNNSNVRKDAFNSYTNGYVKNISNLTELFIDKYKIDYNHAKKRNFNTILEMKMFNSELSENIISNLIKSANKYIFINEKYINFKKKILKLNEFHIYDNKLSICSVPEYEISYKDTCNLVKKSLSILGDDYLKEIDEILNNGWIDVYPKENKRIMSFTSLSYSGSYVLINYKNDIQSARTLAHEIGHRINSNYSRLNNSFINFDISLFLTEIASKVNEMLFNNYIINNSTNVELKKYILNDVILSLINSLFGQMMLTEFENDIVTKIEKEESIDSKYICNTYAKIYKKYNSKIKYQDNIKYDWLKIPHFVMQESYYLFQYTTGSAIAINIADRIIKHEKGITDKYKKFLSSGNRLSPIDTLKIIDVDLNDSKYLDDAYKILNNYVDMIIELNKN